MIFHRLRERSSKHGQARRILVVIPVESLDHVGVEVGFTGRNTDCQVDYDVASRVRHEFLGPVRVGRPGGGAIAGNGSKPSLGTEYGAHADRVSGVGGICD